MSPAYDIFQKPPRKKKKDEQQEQHQRKPPSTIQDIVLFEKLGDSVIARHKGTVYHLGTACACGVPKAGEMWMCYLKEYGPTGIATPCYCTGTVSEPVQETPVIETEAADPMTEEPTEQIIETHSEEPEDKTDELAHVRVELNKCRRLTDVQSAEIKKLKKNLDTERRNNTCLRQQISALDTKRQSIAMHELQSRILNLEEECAALRSKCKGLEEIVRNLSTGTGRTSSGVHDDNFAVLTGESTIHCSAFRDETYRVKFRVNTGELLFVPDIHGMVRCHENAASIPGLKHFAHFDRVRVLDVATSNGIVSICLTRNSDGTNNTMQTA